MNTFRIAQIGSAERLDFSKAKILAPFAGTFAVFADVGVSVIAILNAMRAMKV